MTAEHRNTDPGYLWTLEIKALRPGDPCEFRFPARPGWMPGTIVLNGDSGYWHIRDANGKVHKALYAEYVKAKGGHHYEESLT